MNYILVLTIGGLVIKSKYSSTFYATNQVKEYIKQFFGDMIEVKLEQVKE